jgi:hypothetical protein
MSRSSQRDEATLPWQDESVERLGDVLRAQVGHYWEGRATAELHVASAFSQLAETLAQTGAEASVRQLLDRSIENEHLHSSLCHRLAIRYLGRDAAAPSAPIAALPLFEQAPPEARPALQAAGLCCINESIATVWLERCAVRAIAPLPRAVNHLHLADELFHARVGWAHLASRAVTPSVRSELSRWLVPLLRSNVRQWLSPELTRQTGGVPDHGLPSEAEHRDAVLGAVRNVVIPGFEHCGVDVRAATRWFEDELNGSAPSPAVV